MKQKKNYYWLEILAVIALIFSATIIKSIYFKTHYLEFSFGNEFTDAVIQYGQKAVVYTIYGARYAYETILGIWFSFVGNKPEMAVVFQIALQTISLVMLYITARRLYGRRGAMFSLVMLAFIPYVTKAKTEHFLVFLFAFYALIGTILWKKAAEEKTAIQYFLIVCLGSFIATFAYFDIIGLLFSLIFVLVAVLVPKQKKLIALIAYLLGSALGYVGILLLKIIPSMTEYFETYLGKIEYQVDFFTRIEYKNNVIAVIAVLMFVSFILWIVGLLKGNTKAGVVVSIFMIVVIVMELFLVGVVDYLPIICICMVFLMANGIQAMTEIRQEADIIIAEKPVEIIETEPVIKKTEKPAVQYIENPLPVPKRHVARELNYAFEPSASELKFDVDDLKGRDNFDL